MVPPFAARAIVGRRSKYLVIVFWLAVVLVAVPLAGRLAGAENNDNTSWLPGNAESTKVLDLEASFQSPNLLPAVVVYDRPRWPDGAGRDEDRLRRAPLRVSSHGPTGRSAGPWSRGTTRRPSSWCRSTSVRTASGGQVRWWSG